jgi:hypothetical protein
VCVVVDVGEVGTCARVQVYSMHMKYFVTYQMPHTGLDAWMQLPEEERKKQELDMQTEWNAWMAVHKDAIMVTAGVGKPKRITSEGIVDARNDLMMYSLVEADSLEAAAEMFKDHPHFGIPGASIEVMTANKTIG